MMKDEANDDDEISTANTIRYNELKKHIMVEILSRKIYMFYRSLI